VSSFTLSDLAALPRPEIIETLDFETILALRKAKFIELCIAAGIDYTTINLESDPVAILLQESAYEEMVLRARGNDIARDPYLFYSSGASLDHLGAFYDTTRMPGEADDRYKIRIILGIQGRSTGGTEPRYAYIAMSASIRVASAVVYTQGTSPQVNVAVFATDNNGVADAPLIATVQAALSAANVRMVNDTIVVRSAVVRVVNVTANIWLTPSASDALLTTLGDAIKAQWQAEGALGRDLTVSWLISRLMVSGVHRVSVTAPAADEIVPAFEAVRIGTVTLNLQGRDF